MGGTMPRKAVHRPLNTQQEQTVKVLTAPVLWDGKKVTPKVETTVVVDGQRFSLDEAGHAALLDGDPAKAKAALELLKHLG